MCRGSTNVLQLDRVAVVERLVWQQVDVVVEAKAVVVGACGSVVGGRTIESKRNRLGEVVVVGQAHRGVVIVVVIALAGMPAAVIELALHHGVGSGVVVLGVG